MKQMNKLIKMQFSKTIPVLLGFDQHLPGNKTGDLIGSVIAK
jgi:hypothetical protein